MTNTYDTPWKIGDIDIKNRIVLAPMAGINNKAFSASLKNLGQVLSSLK
jgi:tRNA-dihydrouridine synthase